MKPLIQAGKLTHRVTFQRDDGTADAIGGNVASWADVVTVWAEVVPQTSREFVQGAQIRPDTTVMFRVRYRSGIHSAMRLTWQGRTYNLTGPPINTNGANVELVITAKEPETTT